MKNQLEAIKSAALDAVNLASNEKEIEELRVKYLGKSVSFFKKLVK